MKKLLVTLIIIQSALCSIKAQNPSKSQVIDASEVPLAVKSNLSKGYMGLEESMVQKWYKMQVNEKQVRYVAAYQSMDQTTGQILLTRQRYTPEGNFTSYSFDLGGAENMEKIIMSISPTGWTPDQDNMVNSYKEKIRKIFQENTVVSCKKFVFRPKNQEELISTISFELKDKEGNTKLIFYTYKAGESLTEIDMSQYPIRVLEAKEIYD